MMDDFTDRRDAERLAVNLDVLIHPYRAAPVLCLMHDISAGGALLTTYAGCRLEAGEEVLVECVGMEIVATIARVSGNACGIRFHRRLHALEVADLRAIEREQTPFVPAIPLLTAEHAA